MVNLAHRDYRPLPRQPDVSPQVLPEMPPDPADPVPQPVVSEAIAVAPETTLAGFQAPQLTEFQAPQLTQQMQDDPEPDPVVLAPDFYPVSVDERRDTEPGG